MSVGSLDARPDEDLVELLGGADGALDHVGLALVIGVAGNHRQTVIQPLQKPVLDQRLPINIPPDQGITLNARLARCSLLVQTMKLQPLAQQRFCIER